MLSSKYMNLINRYIRLSSCDRRLLWRTIPLVATMRLRLWLRSGASSQYGLPKASSVAGGRSVADNDLLRRSSWAVRVVSRLIPGATCLTQALALNALLSRDGVTSTVRIGVGHGSDGAFLAHAWVVVDEQVVIGGDTAFYVPLLDLQGGAA